MRTHTGSGVPHTTESTYVEQTRSSRDAKTVYLAELRASLLEGHKVVVEYKDGVSDGAVRKARSEVYSKTQHLLAEFVEHVGSEHIRVRWPEHSTAHHTCTSLHLAGEVHPAEYREYPLPKCTRYSVTVFFKSK